MRARFPVFGAQGLPILPVWDRLGALEAFGGRGVTIAFLDSGFAAHPDLVEPENRILRAIDVRYPGQLDLAKTDESSWHGMMTSVVACGNGRLSGGLYRGLASRAKLVLIKVGTARRITPDNIRRGLEWVLKNRKRYGIRVVNVSCAGDYEASYLSDSLSQVAERASREGILIIAAVGNLGHLPAHPVLPPASAPSVLTVGGLDDRNQRRFAGYGMYHSSYGPTVDGLQKPEVLAPAIWVAAPLLPGSEQASRAELLSTLWGARDADLGRTLAKNRLSEPSLEERLPSPSEFRKQLAARIREEGLVTGAYKHVDGTSFSSPIVASIAAQMFEANPQLTSVETKRILIGTSRRLPGVNTDQQGWGLVDPRQAVLLAAEKTRGALRRPSVQPSVGDPRFRGAGD